MGKNNFSQDYVERDISWMYFNHRILQEAEKKSIPLLERLSFLGIYSNNLDEFFRVRVALLNRIAEYNDKDARTDRQCAIQTPKTINKLNTQYAKEYEATIQQVENDLEKENIYILKDTQLDEMQKNFRPQLLLS